MEVTQVGNADFTLDPFLDGYAISTILLSGSVSEEATPLAPGDSIGATPQATFSGAAKSRWNLAKGKSLIVDMGPTRGAVKAVVSGDNLRSGVVTYTADTLISRLNADVKSQPYVGTIQGGFAYWGSLVGVNSFDIDDDLKNRSIIAPGFFGNLWNFVKEVCSAYGIQVYSTGVTLGVTTPGKIELIMSTSSELNISSDSGQRAQRISIQNYNLKSTVSNVPFFKAEEVYTVALGEKQEIRVPLLGTPFSLFDPTCVATISTIPYVAGNGEYVVTGADGYPMAPARWTANGGSITAKLADDSADEAIIVIQAPFGGDVAGSAPFSISEGTDRPALYISGQGVLRTAETVVIGTGDADAPQQQVDVDNRLIDNAARAWERGVYAAQQYCGSTTTVNISDQGDIIPVQKAYRQYNSAGNLLTDEQASMGRKRNATEGWSFPPEAFGRVVAGSGIQVTYSAKTSDLASFASTQPNTLDANMLQSYKEWLTPVGAGISYTALIRYTRVSGGNTLKIGINWYSASGADLGYTTTNAAAPTTGTSTTATHTATSPAGAAFARIIVRPGITTSFDFLFEKAQLTVGSVSELSFTDWPEVVLTQWFGHIAGSILRIGDAKYRVVSASYNGMKADLKLIQFTTFDDFNKAWAGKTFAEFNLVWSV